MITYKDYEKKVYDWLMAKHDEDENFTFSLRQKGSKGAETDYFIGTENSRYFSTTFWNLPVSFPGSSGDCLTLLFGYTKTGYYYFFEFNQTKAPHDEQNKGALELVQQLQGALKNQIGFQREPNESNKMFSLRTKTTKSSYDTVEDMFGDIEKDLVIIFPIVDEVISNLKKNNPDFKANRLTINEFETINQKFTERILRFENVNTNNETAEDFENFLQKFDKHNVLVYFDFLKGALDYLKLESGDNRLLFTYRDNGLRFTIGQRYSFYLNPKSKKGQFGVLSKDKLNETSTPFGGSSIVPYFTHFDNFKPTPEEKQNILDGFDEQLKRSNQSGYRLHNSPVFEAAVFNHVFGNDIVMKEMETTIKSYTGVYSTAPLNQILYGPPGTGKTYNTVLEAAKIVTGNETISYDEALKIFNDNLGNQIEFITFHQNYSYEDFIQGIRPDTENGKELTFEKKDGVFKRIADRAFDNLKLSEKAPNELSNEALFDKALDDFKESILESEDKYQINETAHIYEVEKEAFRYTGEKWGYINGLRMKFVDLKEFYRNNVKSRKDVKSLTSISGLANQHATYYYLVYEQILKHLPKEIENPVKVEHKNFVIIIDEINRANISRVFGELITLIEEDKRSHGAIPMRVTLPSGDPFIVPSNLYIIGTMNTADKSIALLDIALRRRFDFVPMYPLYDGLEKPINDVEILQKINDAILSRKNHDFTIGHAYFMGKDYTLENTINKKVIPLLLEYFMNDEKEITSILQVAGIKIGGWPLKMIL
jgi:tetratricopeptide (TPR) repeat protein